MASYLTFGLKGWLPQHLHAEVAKLATINDNASKGTILTVLEIEHVHWEPLFDMLKANRCKLESMALLRLQEDSFQWPSRWSETIAAVLEPADVAFLANPAADLLNPECPPIDLVLREGITPQLSEKPQGHLIRAGNRYFASHKLLAVLGMLGGGSPFHKGKPLPGWSELAPTTTCSVLSERCLSGIVPSALCGHPLHLDYGCWFGSDSTIDFDSVCVDELAFGHLDQERAILVPAYMARELAGSFRGLQMQPVYPPDGPRVRLLERILARAQPLVSVRRGARAV